MALDANKNQVFHQRCRNFVQALMGLHEEANRIGEYFVAQVQGQAAFQNTPISTTAEITSMFSVGTDFRNFMSELAVAADANRRDKLMPFMTE